MLLLLMLQLRLLMLRLLLRLRWAIMLLTLLCPKKRLVHDVAKVVGQIVELDYCIWHRVELFDVLGLNT